MTNKESWTVHSVVVNFRTEQDKDDRTIDSYWTVIEEVDGVVTTHVIMSNESIAKEYASQLGKAHRKQYLKRSA